MKLKIEKVEVECRKYGDTALSCVCDNARYHVWLDRHTKEVRPTLYKNPVVSYTEAGKGYFDRFEVPGYFDTRHCSVSSKFGAELIRQMLEIAARGDLFTKALEAERLREEEEARKHQEAVDEAHIKDAARELYDAACSAFTLIRSLPNTGSAELEQLRVAIAKARGVDVL